LIRISTDPVKVTQHVFCIIVRPSSSGSTGPRTVWIERESVISCDHCAQGCRLAQLALN
jgi:hypothetical protein